MFLKMKDLISSIWLMFVTHLPGDAGAKLRYGYWKKRLRHLGENAQIDEGVHFVNPGYIHIGENSWIDRNVTIMAGPYNSKREKRTLKNRHFPGEPGVVFIGKNVHVGPGCILSGISAGLYISDDCGMSANCKLYSLTHHYKSFAHPEKHVITSPRAPAESQCLIDGAIYLGPSVGLALNCVILPGVSLPGNNGVHINSVVFKGRYEKNIRIQGDPAKAIGTKSALEDCVGDTLSV
ncbi:MAG: hypothetical protein JNN05_11525 [Candidatus Omnitrophica bacterium]|nr:hypothetical protein [Candidatus Omnitrophota bacterium]